jgi:hypothetical protein
MSSSNLSQSLNSHCNNSSPHLSVTDINSQDALIAELKKEIDKLNHDRCIDEANIREMSSLNSEYKLKDLDLAAYKSHAEAVDEILEANNQEMRDLRAKVASMEAFIQYGG